MTTMSVNFRRRMMVRKKILVETIEKLTEIFGRKPTMALLAHEYDMPVEWMQRYCEQHGVMEVISNE